MDHRLWQQMLNQSFAPYERWGLVVDDDCERPEEGTFMWVYRQTELGVFTVGFYDPRGEWHPDSDWGTKEEARQQVRLLNGGQVTTRRA